MFMMNKFLCLSTNNDNFKSAYNIIIWQWILGGSQVITQSTEWTDNLSTWSILTAKAFL